MEMVKTEYFSNAEGGRLYRPDLAETVSLRAENLACARGVRVIFSDLGFAIGAGEVLHVTGANGAGKTSLLRMICGLLAPAAGHVAISGVHDGRDIAPHCHYLGHADALKPTLTPREPIDYDTALFAPAMAANTDDLLTYAGLRRQADQRVATLSAGQKRRLTLTRLVGIPRPIWLMDEPYTALDNAGRKLVDTLVRAHADAGGLAIIAAHEEVGVANRQLVLGA